MDCNRAQTLISASSLITACDTARGGALRLQTTFEYPGNEYVDLFVRAQATPDAPLELTDGGMTVGQLLGFGVDPDATERRRRHVLDVCEQLGVRREGGELVAPVAPPVERNFGPTAVRLGQACVRVADLIVTHRSRLTSTFGEELEEGVETLRVPFEVGAPLVGSKGRPVKVDFVVRGPRLPSAVIGVSAKTQGNAKDRVNSALRKWFELHNVQGEYQFVTLLDSRVELWTDADRGVLEDVSTVFAYPAEADAFRELVTNE